MKRIRTAVCLRGLALAASLSLPTAYGAPSISNLRLAASPDSPHYYLSTFSYAAFPTNVSVSPGALVYFTVSATGTAPISYQWYANGQSIPGATCSGVGTCTYGAPGVELPPADYSVVVSDASSLSITSRVVTLLIDPTFFKINAFNGSSGSLNPIVTDRGWSNCGGC